MTIQEILDEKQRIFTIVVNHARKQRAKSTVFTTNVPGHDGQGETVCAYRSKENLSCFAGCLIKDEFYQPILEAQGSNQWIVQNALVDSGVMPCEEIYAFVRVMQTIHDHNIVEQWEGLFAFYAKQMNLTIPDPTEEYPMLEMMQNE